MVDIFKARTHLTNFLRRTLEASNGLLNDQRPRSILSVLGRAFSEGLSDFEQSLTADLETSIAESVPRLFGLSTSEGTKAKVILVFTPATIDNIRSFEIAAGFRATVNGVIFETDTTMTVPPGGLNGSVLATATIPGDVGNVPANSLIDWEVTPGLLNIANPQSGYGGIDAKNIDNLASDVVQTLINRALITADNFTYVAQQFLGSNATVITIPNLALDNVSFERGVMHVYALKNGVALDSATKGNLLLELSKGWATIYISDLIVSTLNIRIYLKADTVENQENLAITINNQLRTLFNTLTYTPGNDIDVMDTVGILYKIAGVRQIGSVQFGKNTSVTEMLDIPLAVNETVMIGFIELTYSDPIAYYIYQ